MKKIIGSLLVMGLVGCGGASTAPKLTPGTFQQLTPIGVSAPDGTVVRGRAFVQLGNTQETALFKFLGLMMPHAYAATGSVNVTYTNAASVNFTIDTSALAPTTPALLSGDTLDLGTVTIATLSDNHLKVCNPGGNTKCTQATIRLFTTGSVAGFVHTVDNYGAPLYASGLNPSTALGLNSGGSVQVQTAAIPGNRNKLTLANSFPSPSYDISSDFSNAGSGSYSAVLVLEYVLAP